MVADHTLDIEFIIVDSPLVCYAIMGHDWIHHLEVVPSTLYQVMRCLAKAKRSTIDIHGDSSWLRDAMPSPLRSPITSYGTSHQLRNGS
ncbi:hypothetical protein QJS04_geneDACA013341 [Acorus gramineus]|uniref:Uncharacterized protein n=1 Tax=Acorus gramineus TaxID=55184 RepID=A0AAV9A813_ACOGR|nr:hypothetical protein QJS04_geneDACA013341 [Acorus gramineus]